ncbi:MAG: class I SAM-dependent RNA methyltransferase [bacterium]|nr:class I SAM-dependent RNA methyltransferase [bacterium]
MKKGAIEKITNGGWGLLRSDDGVVFLNYVLPGEEVSYRVKDKARGILWGELLEVLTPSENRTEPPCPYFGQCGGCIFQHIHYGFQKKIKQDILQDDLKRIGHYEPPPQSLPAIIESPPYHNRIRARMKAQEGEGGKIGFIRKGTNTVIPIQNCLLFPEEINRFLEKWNTSENPPFFYQMDILMNPTTQKTSIHLSHPPKKEKEILNAFPEITFSWKGNEDTGVSKLKINDRTYLVSPAVFFQVNPFQWENMLNTVESYLEPCKTIIDLYSGVGFFIPLLKKYARRVIGIESHGYSVTLAGRAFPNIDFLRIPVEKFNFTDADILVVDPPRSGLSKHVINGILHKKYPKVIYISCSSATFSRDLKILRENGYELKDLKIFDLFPQTPHLETISLLEG